MRIGLFGGTFDPVHRGHLDVAAASLRALPLDEVWFIPAGRPPHRSAPGASAAHRFAMVALALAGQRRLRVSDIEMTHDGPTYTIETLARLEVRYPALAGSFCFIAGADAFAEIRTWREWQALVDRCPFAVVSRPGLPVDALPAQLPELAARMKRPPLDGWDGIYLIDAPTTDVSASALREAFRTGRDLSNLLPGAVAEYAVREHLYDDQAPEAARG